MILKINIDPRDADAISLMREINSLKTRQLMEMPESDRNDTEEELLKMTITMDRILAQLYHGCMYRSYKSGMVSKQKSQMEMHRRCMVNGQTSTNTMPSGYTPVEDRDPYKTWSKSKKPTSTI